MGKPDWVSKLDAEGFLAVYDVLIDIQKELNLASPGEHIEIPLWQPLIKFTQLFPADSTGMRDRYCELRWKATKFLKDKGIVREFSIINGSHRWENRILVIADQDTISPTLGSMGLDYDRRIAEDTPHSAPGPRGGKVFIGHGRSRTWKDLRDFLKDRLKLDWAEFNRDSVAGLSTKERLEELLNESGFAFLVMTAEDEHEDGSHHARENVIHEAGLFQGRLGFRRAIIVLENGCAEFSNIHGLGQIRFPPDNIQGIFEDIRRVLERESLLKNKEG